MEKVRFGTFIRQYQVADGLVKEGKITVENIDQVEAVNKSIKMLDPRIMEYARRILGK
ncbi:MAG: hypothetical protein QW597_06390 [Thermoplasmataceae archaeon]